MRRTGITTSVLAITLLACTAMADEVILKSGAIIRGQVLSEDAYEVRIVVSKTASGSIKTLKIVDQSAVARMTRNQPEVAIEPELEPGFTATPAPEPKVRAHDDMDILLSRGDALMEIHKPQEAALLYRRVAEQAQSHIDALYSTEESASQEQELDDTMVLRERAYRFLIVAMEGQRERWEEIVTQQEDELDRIRDEIRDCEHELEAIERARKSASSKRSRTTTRLGQWSRAHEGTAREQELEENLAVHRKSLALKQEQTEAQKLAIIDLKTQLALAEEKADLARDEHKALTHRLRKRARDN